MIPIEVEQWLSAAKNAREIVTERVDGAVRTYCTSQGYAYLGRSKADTSVAEKLETGRVRSLSEFDDLFGCSIIVPNLSHEQAAVDWLEKTFTLQELRKRHGTKKNPDIFRFEATRFIGKLRLTDADDTRLRHILFEVQIRTAFEHAWSQATHGPAYKTDTVDWRLERLAAQMKALVEQLDMLAVAYQQSAQVIEVHPCERTEAEARVFEAFSKFRADGTIPEECEPVRWGQFAKNVVSLIHASNWGKWIALEERVETVISRAGEALAGHGPGGFPRSLSLFQFVLGVLVQTKTVRLPFRDASYCPPVSAALELLFPLTRGIVTRCSLDNPFAGGAHDSRDFDTGESVHLIKHPGGNWQVNSYDWSWLEGGLLKNARVFAPTLGWDGREFDTTDAAYEFVRGHLRAGSAPSKANPRGSA